MTPFRCIYSFLAFFVIFSFPVFSIEISDDMFIEPDNNIETEGVVIEKLIEEPHIKRVKTVKKEVIKVKEPNLAEVLLSIDKEQNLEPDYILDQKSQREKRSPASVNGSSRSIDYGDYELHWSREKP